MTIEEAINIIEGMTPCANCKYRNTGCKRADQHVWSDGFCHEVEEALEIIKEIINYYITPEDENEPENSYNDGNLEPQNYNDDEDIENNNEDENNDSLDSNENNNEFEEG